MFHTYNLNKSRETISANDSVSGKLTTTPCSGCSGYVYCSGNFSFDLKTMFSNKSDRAKDAEQQNFYSLSGDTLSSYKVIHMQEQNLGKRKQVTQCHLLVNMLKTDLLENRLMILMENSLHRGNIFTRTFLV